MLFHPAVEIALDKIAPAFAAQPRSQDGLGVIANKNAAYFIAALLAAIHVALAVTAILDKSPTFDEPVHLAAGYSYWLRNDFRLDPENGTLPARWAALPLTVNRPSFPPPDSRSWSFAHIEHAPQQFFYALGNNPDDLLLQGRMMMSAFSGALCLLIFFCARRLFGTIGGIISEMIAVFDPNLLAHGALVTSDTATAFFFTATVWSIWRLLHRISPRTFTLAFLSAGGLFLTKMSAPLVVIMAGILGVLRIFLCPGIQVGFSNFQRVVLKKTHKALLVALVAMAITVTILVAIWAAYGFRFSAITEDGLQRKLLNGRWEAVLADHTFADGVIAFARDHHLLPEAYLFGLAYVDQTSKYRPAFLDNHWSNVGFSSFFPRAFVYKTPLPIFGLAAVALLAAVIRWRRLSSDPSLPLWKVVSRDCLELAPIFVLVLVYGAVALLTNLNIGHRHLLPIYPALFIACGACACAFRQGHVRLAGALVGFFLSWQIIESFSIHPDYLAYFNQVAGGPANGYHHLVDSSLDWGQDLPALKTWLDHSDDQLAGQSVYLGYFGTGDAGWYKIPATILPESAEPLRPLRPGLYCVSATILQQVYGIERGKWAQPYEEAYQNARTRLQSQEEIDGGSAATKEPVDPKTLEMRSWRIQIFERLRFARLCAYLRHREPIANIGYSILIFRLSGDDLRAALDGPPAELAPKIEVVGR